MLTGDRDVTSVVHAMKLGASDYLVKPTPLGDLELAVGQARERQRLRTENLGLRARLSRHEPKTSIVTEDPAFLQVVASLAKVGPSDLPVLIQGESGAGKELLARAIHDASHRSMEPFVAFDFAAVPEAQIERDLFGYERGAFEGASERKPGVFELADRGTLFLNGIGEINPAVQPRLLRVLETSEFSRLGSARAIRAHVRLVSATNKDLSDPRRRGALREDLYGQINGVTLVVPPLRDRPADVLPLSVHFLKSHGIRRGISPAAIEALKAYPWPGNVRELQMVIRRAGVLARGEQIEAKDLALDRSPE
jgi:two-component system NtrC family response regulator/two-component system response regulator AtoC